MLLRLNFRIAGVLTCLILMCKSGYTNNSYSLTGEAKGSQKTNSSYLLSMERYEGHRCLENPEMMKKCRAAGTTCVEGDGGWISCKCEEGKEYDVIYERCIDAECRWNTTMMERCNRTGATCVYNPEGGLSCGCHDAGKQYYEKYGKCIDAECTADPYMMMMCNEAGATCVKEEAGVLSCVCNEYGKKYDEYHNKCIDAECTADSNMMMMCNEAGATCVKDEAGVLSCVCDEYGKRYDEYHKQCIDIKCLADQEMIEKCHRAGATCVDEGEGGISCLCNEYGKVYDEIYGKCTDVECLAKPEMIKKCLRARATCVEREEGGLSCLCDEYRKEYDDADGECIDSECRSKCKEARASCVEMEDRLTCLCYDKGKQYDDVDGKCIDAKCRWNTTMMERCNRTGATCVYNPESGLTCECHDAGKQYYEKYGECIDIECAKKPEMMEECDAAGATCVKGARGGLFCQCNEEGKHYDENDKKCISSRGSKCSRNQIRCKNKCIELRWICDRNMDCVDMSDEIGCPNKVHVLWNMTVQNARQRVANSLIWLKQQRRTIRGWGKDTNRVVVTLYLSNPVSFNTNSVSNEVTIRDLQFDLLRRIQRSKNDPMSTQEMAHYTHALLAACSNPENFFTTNLVEPMITKLNSSRSVDPFVALALCNANGQVPEAKIAELISTLKQTVRPDLIGRQAYALMALNCIHDKSKDILESIIQKLGMEDPFNSFEGIRNSTLSRLMKSQQKYGNFGDAYITALVLQALLSSEEHGYNFRLQDILDAFNYILSKNISEPPDSITSAYLLLPLFSGKSLLNLGRVNCSLSPFKDPPTEVIVPDQRVWYLIWIGDDKRIQHNMSISVKNVSTFYDVMVKAADIHKKYKFEYVQFREGKYVTVLADLRNNPEAGKYWYLFRIGDKNTRENYIYPDKVIPRPNEKFVYWYRSMKLDGEELQGPPINTPPVAN